MTCSNIITIITSTLNVLSELELTAVSIFQQSYPDWQWIIIDGASDDGTKEWLEVTAQSSPNMVFLSEQDSGIYEAWNKAIPLIQGDWVIFLGAGDTFFDTDTLKNCNHVFKEMPLKCTLAYGGVYWIDPNGNLPAKLDYQKWKGLKGPWRTARPAMPCHQGIFHRASLFHEGFRFDTRLKIAADSELVLRELLAGKSKDLNRVVAHMLTGGIGNNRTNRLRLICEAIYVNWKIGIFWKRPLFQLAMVFSNIIKHIFLTTTFIR